MIMNRIISRRALVKGCLVAGALVPVAGLFNSAAYAESPALDPGEPTAKALNYVTKSAKGDASCANCAQFQGKAGDAMGPCAIFPGKSVASAGWCSAWVKKAAP
jgi:High potential iron-sulfur protein